MTTELEKCRLEMKGPYFDEADNRKLRAKQKEARLVSDLEDKLAQFPTKQDL